MPTVEERKLKFIGRQTDKIRNAVIDFYIEPPDAPGPRQGSRIRHLIARYETGGANDLPMVDGRREFATGIPDGWTEDQLMRKLQEDYGPLAGSPPQTKQ